ncbi:c6 finger domain-containing [Trichoderma arundinaceum]|uniref:C6 finger domain-containing n=1 Tax=Trichoderma arundinaceum TaxID=490622 RepID=A0A395NAV8_TRIAR|nr:c6 finger domain-containing [Trichoderma arundinaceum]
MGPLTAGSGLASQLGVSPWLLYSVAGATFYAILCSTVRFRRLNSMRKRFNFPDRESLSRMTNEDAQKIVHQMSTFEFPLLYDFSLRYAVFKTYAIDNVGNLLFKVSDLAKPAEASKRYATFPPGSETLAKSVARTNFLHQPYRQSGKIRNEDLLYVLFASMYEPIRFMRLYEWRELSDMEVAAISMFWKYLGEMMEIDYKAELGKDQWKDGIEFMEDLAVWAAEYENEHLGPSPDIAKLGQVLVDLLLSAYPAFSRDSGYKILMVLMGERMRHAFSFPEPGVPESALAYTLLLTRKLFVRYLCLPRIFPAKFVDPPDPVTGRIKHYHYLKDPWYTPVTFWSRWGPEALFRRAFGLKVPGDGGAAMLPDGFLFEDLGPRDKMGKGVDETARLARVAQTKVSASACPFALPKKA